MRTVRRSHGFTMVEVVVATLVISLMLAGALRGVAASKSMRTRLADRTRAQQLAVDMLSEVLQQTYTPPVVSDPAARSGWTCVDSYNNLTDSPLRTKAGNPILDVTGLTRTVAVTSIDPATLNPTSALDTGIKRITVTVSRGPLVLATVAGFRTVGWVEAMPTPDDATGNHAPAAVATYTPVDPRARSDVTFSGAGSSDVDNNTLSYSWNFGDGTSGTGVSVIHPYAVAGTYNVTLTVTDGFGGVAIGTATVTVKP